MNETNQTQTDPSTHYPSGTHSYSMASIVRAVKAQGSHWFDSDTIEFFGTKLPRHAVAGPGGIYFVTSEQPPYGERQYTIRQHQSVGAPKTVGEFCSWPTEAEADREAKRLASGAPSPASMELAESLMAQALIGKAGSEALARLTSEESNPTTLKGI